MARGGGRGGGDGGVLVVVVMSRSGGAWLSCTGWSGGVVDVYMSAGTVPYDILIEVRGVLASALGVELVIRPARGGVPGGSGER